MSENKNLPAGWGNDDEDYNYGYDTFDDESNEPSPWNTKSKKPKISESVNEEKISSSDVPDKDKVIALQTTPPIHKQKNSKNSENSESENESDFARTFAGIIVFLVLILAVSIGIMFLQKKDDNNIINTPIEDVIEEKSNEVTFYGQGISRITDLSKKIINSGVRLFEFQHVEDSAYKPTETDAETIEKTEETTVPVTKPEIPNSSAQETPAIDFNEAARQALYSHLEAKKYDEFYTDANPKYYLCDIDGNDVPELFISYLGAADTNYDLYVYKNGKYEIIESFWGGLNICLEENLIESRIYGGTTIRRIYKLIDSECLLKDTLKSDGNSGDYLYNDEGIDKNEYDRLNNQYDSMNWISIYGVSSEFSDMIDMSSNNNMSTVNKYSTYDTSAAPADMYFISESEGGMRGSVKTESGPLNLRAGASTDADVIVQMPKDSEVIVYGANNDWCYVYFYSDGMQYYGYASAQYIDINSVG